MKRYSSFVRSFAVGAALILGLLMCCQAALAGGPKDQNENTVTPETPTKVKETPTKVKKEYQPPAPETLDIGQGLGPLALWGPWDFGGPGGKGSVGDSNVVGRGGELPIKTMNDGRDVTIYGATSPWGDAIIQNVGPLTPNKSEVARFSTQEDLTAGEALDDDTFVSKHHATYAKSSSVVLEVPISWIGTGLQAGPGVGGGAYTDGDTGVYTARVEDCLSASDHTKLKQVKDKDDKPIKCTTADGVLGREGYWYDLGDPWSNIKYLSLDNEWVYGQPGLPQKTITDKLSLPVDLPVPVNSIRVEFELGLKDSHCSKNCDHLATRNYMPVYAYPTAHDPYVESWRVVTGQNSQGQATETAVGPPQFLVTRFAIQLPPITVLPAAFVQMKVLPYTILYRPTGNRSQGVYATTESYGTSMTTGKSTSIDNTTAFMDSMNVQNNSKVNLLILSVGQQDSSSMSSGGLSDINSTIGTGLVVSNSHSKVRTWTLGTGSSGNADPTIFPAAQFVTPNTCTPTNYVSSGCTENAGETFSQEPFWEDRIVVLLNPTAELWDFKAGTTMQLLGAEDYDAISINDLSACAQYSGKFGWTLAKGSQLTPKECLDLLGLDPYYMAGQSLNPSKSNRGVSVGGGTYGTDPEKPGSTWVSTNFQEIFTYSSAQSTSASASYLASVTNVVGFSWSDGMTMGADYKTYGLDVGVSDGTTVTQGNQSTSGTQMKVTYTASTVGTSTTTTQISGTFGDDHDFDTPDCQADPAKCYTPRVNVYIDELFGSYMFSDPDAPPNPFGPGILPVRLKVPAEPVPMEVPRTGAMKTTITPATPAVSPVVSPAAGDVRFDVIYINAANLLDPSKIKGILTWSKGELSLEEGGQEIFKATAADIKEIDMNTVLGVSAGSFHILLSNGKKYDFWAASLIVSDTESIEESLKSAVH